MRILFVTSNPKKIVSPARVLERYGVEVGHVNPRPEIMEIQAVTPSEVAVQKAREAFARVRKPLFCMDSAFFVHALNGFPGTALKQVTRQIGAEGFLRLMETRDGSAPLSRDCDSVDAIAYMDETLCTPELFVRCVRGVLTRRAYGMADGRHKSDLFRIFRPTGEAKPLAAMTEAEYEAYRKRDVVEGFYHAFGQWLRDR